MDGRMREAFYLFCIAVKVLKIFRERRKGLVGGENESRPRPRRRRRFTIAGKQVGAMKIPPPLPEKSAFFPRKKEKRGKSWLLFSSEIPITSGGTWFVAAAFNVLCERGRKKCCASTEESNQVPWEYRVRAAANSVIQRYFPK